MQKKLIVLLAVGIATFAFWSPAAFAQFDDVPSDHWAYDAVEYLADEGLVLGYPDGSFRGDQQLTRYEFAMVISRLYDMFLDLIDEGQGPGIDVEAILDMLMDEFQPELDELMELAMSNAERIGALEGTVGGFDDRIAAIGDMVDGMDARFHPYGAIYLRFLGTYRDVGLDAQRPQFMLRWGFTSQVTDELSFCTRFTNGEVDPRQNSYDTLGDAFEYDAYNIDRAYMMWQPNAYQGLTVWAGKFGPSWMATPMTYDTDLQWEGLAQHFAWRKFNFYLAELLPADKGFYLLAQAQVDDFLIDNTKLAVTYHYITSEAWQFLRADMIAGDLTSKWDFTRLESADDYRAIEVYWHWQSEVMSTPFKVRLNYLRNLEDTAPGLPDEAGWQQAAWGSIAFHDLTIRDPGDWNIWGEYGRIQANSAITWVTDALRGRGDSEFFWIGWKYRLLTNTDLTIAYWDVDSLSGRFVDTEWVMVAISTKFN